MKQIALATLMFFTAAIAAPVTVGAQAAQAQKATPLSVPVVGTGTNEAGATGTFNGTLKIQRFATSQGSLVAVGLLTGIVTSTLNGVTTNASVVRTVTMPATVGGQQATSAGDRGARRDHRARHVRHPAPGPRPAQFRPARTAG